MPEFVKYVNSNLPKCTQVLVSNGDILNVEKAKELVDAGMDKFIITVHDKNPERNLERLKPVKEFLKYKMKLQTSNDLYLNNRGGAVDVSHEKRKTTYKKCQDIKNLNITVNGDVVLCCQDYFKKYIMGNIISYRGYFRNMEFLQGYKREIIERQYSRIAYMQNLFGKRR